MNLALYRRQAWKGSTHHQSDHNGQPVSNLVGRFDEDDRETDGHADDPAQESCGTDQGEGPRVDVAQADVAGQERSRDHDLESQVRTLVPTHTRACSRTDTHTLTF